MAKQEEKFKIGDKVKLIANHQNLLAGAIGVVKRVYNGSNELGVELENNRLELWTGNNLLGHNLAGALNQSNGWNIASRSLVKIPKGIQKIDLRISKESR